MYGTPYTYSGINASNANIYTKTQLMLDSGVLSHQYYSDTIDYGIINTNKYTLVNPSYIVAPDNFAKLIGKYTFRNASPTYSNKKVMYVVHVEGSMMYYKELSNGQTRDDIRPILFGKSIIDNGDGTYTLENIETVEYKDWCANPEKYKGMYTCNNETDTCTNPRYVTTASKNSYNYADVVELNESGKILIAKTRNGTTLTDTLLVTKEELIKNYANYSDYKYTCDTSLETCTEESLKMITEFTGNGYAYVNNYYFGTSVTYEDGKYKLVDPLGIESVTNLNDISTHHYICASLGKKECSTVGYVYYYTGTGTMYYITLKDGDISVNTALDKMLNQNTTSSTMKIGLEAWYKKHLLKYSPYIEDTIYCNDRSYKNFESSGWNENGGNTTNYLQFKENSITSDLSCTKQTDQFSTSNSSAKLMYPIGLATRSEMDILNNARIRNTTMWYWVASPSLTKVTFSVEQAVNNNGNLNDTTLNGSYGVRPTISLIAGTEYVSGNGSTDDPYVVE